MEILRRTAQDRQDLLGEVLARDGNLLASGGVLHHDRPRSGIAGTVEQDHWSAPREREAHLRARRGVLVVHVDLDADAGGTKLCGHGEVHGRERGVHRDDEHIDVRFRILDHPESFECVEQSIHTDRCSDRWKGLAGEARDQIIEAAAGVDAPELGLVEQRGLEDGSGVVPESAGDRRIDHPALLGNAAGGNELCDQFELAHTLGADALAAEVARESLKALGVRLKAVGQRHEAGDELTTRVVEGESFFLPLGSFLRTQLGEHAVDADLVCLVHDAQQRRRGLGTDGETDALRKSVQHLAVVDTDQEPLNPKLAHHRVHAQDDLGVSRSGGGTNDVGVELTELAVASSLWGFPTEHVSHFVAAEREGDRPDVLGDVSCKRDSEIEAGRDHSLLVEDEPVTTNVQIPQPVLDRFSTGQHHAPLTDRSLQWHETKPAVNRFDRAQDATSCEHLTRAVVLESAGKIRLDELFHRASPVSGRSWWHHSARFSPVKPKERLLTRWHQRGKMTSNHFTSMSIVLTGETLTIEEVACVSRKRERVLISENARAKLERARTFVDRLVKEEKVVYGVTTGFGQFKNVVISPDQTATLQTNLIRSHATGVGAPLPEDMVRASILVRINSLLRGHSGVRSTVIDRLLDLLNHDIYPYVPSQGSVGSSGDLAPLSHIMLVLMGEGEVLVDGKRKPSLEVLREKGLGTITLMSKEGLALNNGTSVQTGIGALAVFDARRLADVFTVAYAMSLEVLMGSVAASDPRVHALRPHPGQSAMASTVRRLCLDSQIIESHRGCGRVQDAYSLRCAPQVQGASRDTIEYVASVVTRELNSVTDNPLLFPEDDQAISAGHFHGEPIAQVMDFLKIGVSELANISERRIARLTDPSLSDGLPAFLIPKEQGGLSSGMMIPQYVAAALVSENKVLAHPASVDSIPTSANQEDHVSMGTIAARQAAMIVENARQVAVIELLCAAQGVDFRAPLRPGRGVQAAHRCIRQVVPFFDQDRVVYPSLEALANLVPETLLQEVEGAVGRLH